MDLSADVVGSAVYPYTMSTEILGTLGRWLSMTVFELAAMAVAAAAFWALAEARRRRRIRGEVPVTEWPVLGMLPALVAHIDDVYDWFSGALIRSGGTFFFRGPWLSSVHGLVTADPANVEHMLKTRFEVYPKGPHFRSLVRDLLGDGIFNADGELWRTQRKPASIEFHSAAFRAHSERSLRELVHHRLLPIVHDFATRGQPLDLQDVLLRLTFDNVCMLAFGVDPGCLSQGLPEIPFARAFEAATEITAYRFVTPIIVWRTMRFLNIGTERTLRQSLLQIDRFANSVIDARTATTNAGRDDILSIFMRQKDESGLPYSRTFLRDICINFILAGRDTSSVALSWFFWLVDRHPEVEAKLLADIAAAKSATGSDEENEWCFSIEQLKRMQYLQAALAEALRLYPSVPVDQKELAEDDRLPDGTFLRKGTKVLYLIYAMGRMKSIWGPDCLEFRPERWLSAGSGTFVSESAYRFTAFNGGPRLCLGKDFAYLQMKWVAASLLARYCVRVVPGHPVKPKLGLTLYMKHGLLVTLHPRQTPLSHYLHKPGPLSSSY